MYLASSGKHFVNQVIGFLGAEGSWVARALSFSQSLLCSWPRVTASGRIQKRQRFGPPGGQLVRGLCSRAVRAFAALPWQQWHPRWWPLHPDSESDGPSITLRMGCEQLKPAEELWRQLLSFQGVHSNRDGTYFTAATLFHRHV